MDKIKEFTELSKKIIEKARNNKNIGNGFTCLLSSQGIKANVYFCTRDKTHSSFNVSFGFKEIEYREYNKSISIDECFLDVNKNYLENAIHISKLVLNGEKELKLKKRNLI